MATDTIDTTICVQAPGRNSAYLDWLQILTGAGLILFMRSYVVLVVGVSPGAGAMNTLTRFFEGTYMTQVGGGRAHRRHISSSLYSGRPHHQRR